MARTQAVISIRAAAACLALGLLAGPVLGGGARVVDGSGVPMAWDNTASIVWNPDPGPLGFESGTAAAVLVGQAFSIWSFLPGVSLSFVEGGALPYDVDAAYPAATNPAHWSHFWKKSGDGLSPVIFDADGAIVDDMYGVGARFDILGLGGIDTPLASSCTITEGSILINGAFQDGEAPPSSPADLSFAAIQAVMVHEIGHFLNLDHSLVNHEMANDGDPQNDRYLPTMYPFRSDDDEAFLTPAPDDEAAAAALYPAPGLPSSTGIISGSVLLDGAPFQGAHVVARRVDDPKGLAYGAFSGGLYFPGNPTPCAPPPPPGPDAGSFVIEGLPPGDYVVCVEQPDRRVSFANGTFAGPLATPSVLMGPEECWDDVESADPVTDDPESRRVESLAAGGSITATIHLDDFPASDILEPNNTLMQAQPVPGLGGGQMEDTIAARLQIDDPDYYLFDALAGDIVRIDVEAAEIGSPLDPVIAVLAPLGGIVPIDGGNFSDDAVDPDSGSFTLDPAATIRIEDAGSYAILVTGYPDLDLDGLGQSSSGPYFLRITIDRDADADGTVDRLDVCPHDADEDADGDGFCADGDNCPSVYNPDQTDADGDGYGDESSCDNCPLTYNPSQADADGDLAGDLCDLCPFSASDDQDSDGVCDNIDSCPTVPDPLQNGGAPVRLNGLLAPGSAVLDWVYRTTPDGLRMVYVADQDTPGVAEIYSVDSGGGPSTKLNPPLVAEGGVASFQISPDGSRVVYAAVQDTPGAVDLYSVPVTGGTVDKLTAPPNPVTPQVIAFSFAGSDRVVYLADQVSDEKYELFSVPVDASAPAVQISGPIVSEGDVTSFAVTPDGSSVVYIADEVDEVFELFSVPAAGGTATKLNPALPTGGDVHWVAIAAPGAAPPVAVYTADEDTDGVLELYSVKLDASGLVHLNPTPVAGGSVSSFRVSPDGTRVVYRADLATDEVYELRSVGARGFNPVVLNQALVPGGDVTSNFAVSTDSARVVFVADADIDQFFELYSVPILGGGVTEIGTSMVPSGDISIFSISPDSSRVYFVADAETDEMFEIFGVPIDGGTVVKLNQSFTADADVTAFDTSPDGLSVVFQADALVDERYDLFAAPALSGPVWRVNPDPVPGGFVSSFILSPDNRRVFYHAVQDSATVEDLYSAFLPRDLDADAVLDSCDNCPSTSNSTQADGDMDGVGDACDICPFVANPGQEDLDTALGDDLVCGTQDDNSILYGPDGQCGTLDDIVGDGHGDACQPYLDLADPLLALAGEGSAGVAWGDYDGDGDPDLYVTNGATANRLFANDGAGSFSDVTSGPLGNSGQGTGASWGDYDNDGDPDLYVANYPGANVLLRNDGGGSFTDVTSGPLGDTGTTVVAPWIDYDRDGLLDLLLVKGSAGSALLRNEGGAFVDVTPALLAQAVESSAAAWGDYDVDGFPDLYLVRYGAGNLLLRNDGAGGFTDATAGPEGDTGLGNGASWGDYDNDGDLDLFLANEGSCRLFRQDGLASGSFSDVTSAPLDATGNWVSPSWADPDNDGDLDLYVTRYDGPNRLYRNDGGTFVDATSGPLQDPGGSLGAAWADVDMDGDVDLFIAHYGGDNRLALNSAAGENHWLQVELRGRTSNRAAIGARVRVDVPGGPLQVREVTGGYGFASQDSQVLSFGLGTSTTASMVQIDWPSPSFGPSQVLLDVVADQRIIVMEADTDPPYVSLATPFDGALDVPLMVDVLLSFSEPVDPESVSPSTVFLRLGGQKVAATIGISTDRRTVRLLPQSTLSVDSDYTVEVTQGVKDLAGLGAIPYQASFDTTSNVEAPDLALPDLGTTVSGKLLSAVAANELYGYAGAVVGDVNGDGYDDIAIGAPGSDPNGLVDAGKLVLYFGGSSLGNGSTVPVFLEFTGGSPSDAAGDAVAAAGDVNGDGLDDFLVGASRASPNGTESGKAYLVFGSPGLDELAPGPIGLDTLTACVWPAPPCGITFSGAAAGDHAGAALSSAGNVNGDPNGDPDILIGAPGDPNGPGAGKVYLVYGPLGGPAPIALADVGGSVPGLVLQGESPGDAAGSAVSGWSDFGVGQVDDFLIGAPGASVQDDQGQTLDGAGLVYGVFGGTANLDDKAISGVIELSRVASGETDQVAGVVFIGSEENQSIGRSVEGSLDMNGDGQPDILIGGSGQVWFISGDGPKGATSSGTLTTTPGGTPSGVRSFPAQDVVSQFGAAFFTAGADGDLGGSVVARAGDINNDGYDDLVVGAPGVDAGMEVDSGKAYVVLGSPVMPPGERLLSEIGSTLPGTTITGAQAGDLMGHMVGGGGDVNGDGVDDILLGAPLGDLDPTTPTDAGEAYLLALVSPPEIVSIDLTGTGTAATLEWDPSPVALSYNVYRGLLGPAGFPPGGVKTSSMSQLACGITSDSDMDGRPDLTDMDSVAAGSALYYLVTGRNQAGEGPLRLSTPVPPRVNDAQCP